MKNALAYIIILWMSAALLSCGDKEYKIYVSLNGNDSAGGQLSTPVASLQRAASLAREKAGKVPVTVFLSGGHYSLTEPLELGTEDGGSADAPIRWKAMHGEKPIISGGILVKDWTQEDDGTWSAVIPSGFNKRFRSFYINGKPAVRARHPDNDYLRVEKAGADNRTNFFFGENDFPTVKDAKGVELVFLHDWSITRIGVKSIDWNSNHLMAIDSIGARLPFFTITGWEPQPRYYLENAHEYCDTPGEWYCDFNERKIYYYPLPSQTIDETEGVIPVAPKLIMITGSKEKHTGFISFEGIVFEHTEWQLPGKGYCGVQACMFTNRQTVKNGWSKIPAAIELDFADNCTFKNCTVRNVGGSGIWIRENCQNCEISNSHIYDISANGINIGEGKDRLVNGIPWWKSTPGEVSKNNKVTQSVIENCGRQFYGAIGIWCGLVSNTVIEHNEIRNLPYSGISVGWMWDTIPTPCRENTIHANHIHHIMNILHDGGGIYILGLQSGTRIIDNLIHDVPTNESGAESNGMFIDEGSSELFIENNIIYHIGRSPLRFHKAIRDTVRNNVLVYGDGIPPIRYNRIKEENIINIDNIILNQSSESDMKRLEKIIKKRISDIGPG